MQPVNSFWSYLMPMFGAFVADQYLGRFRTIMWSIVVAMVGHTVLVISAISSSHRASIRRSCVFFHWIGDHGCWNGWLQVSTPSPALTAWCNANPSRANISPLIAEQYQLEAHVRTLPSGERVLVDPNATIARIYLYFYLMINVGSLVGSISMVYAERYVGFWLAFLLPTAMFSLCPTVLYICRKRYVRVPPGGSVYSQAFRLWRFALRQWTPYAHTSCMKGRC